MERRRLLHSLMILPALMLSSCSSEEDEALDACAERDKDTRDYIEHVSSALDDVESDLDNFTEGGDWRDALSELRSSVDSLRKVVDEMKQELDS